MTSFWGHQDNPFPPYDDEPIGTDADGVPYYEGDEIVDIDGAIYRYDDLDVKTVLTALGIPLLQPQSGCRARLQQRDKDDLRENENRI